ncbi:hypothetical protein [Sphaerimonospora mesophila]|uniref:hypothetical protein n=1 Tax=Sphaerimonospora mesophila TaxID=37483 RepID=UPI00128EAA02
MVRLERGGEDIVWLSLDSTATTITDIEVLDGRDLARRAAVGTPLRDDCVTTLTRDPRIASIAKNPLTTN